MTLSQIHKTKDSKRIAKLCIVPFKIVDNIYPLNWKVVYKTI